MKDGATGESRLLTFADSDADEAVTESGPSDGLPHSFGGLCAAADGTIYMLGGSPAEPAAVPRNTRRRKVGVAALLVAVGGLAGLVASRQMMRPRAGEIKVQEESPSTPSKVLSSSDMRLLYSKHARLSLDPKAECAWLSSTLGLDAHFTNVSESTTQGTHLCAELCEAMTLNGVALSDSKSWGTNAGSMKPVRARARRPPPPVPPPPLPPSLSSSSSLHTNPHHHKHRASTPRRRTGSSTGCPCTIV